MSADFTFKIKHIKGRSFHILTQDHGEPWGSDPVEVPSPYGFPLVQVQGDISEQGQDGHAQQAQGPLDLMHELRWYLENFLTFPHLTMDRAARARQTLKRWGQQVFEALFASRKCRRIYDAAARLGHDKCRILIESDDPAVLSWPWEGLHDPEHGDMSQLGGLERRLDNAPELQALHESLPKDHVHVLLVTARPKKEDVAYRSVSKPLVDMVHDPQRNLPVRITVLRPPTLETLRQHLKEHAGEYHILHFDGHGGFGKVADHPDAPHATFSSGPEGLLEFEDAYGKSQEVSSRQLETLLKEACLPMVVLNACRAAMINDQAEDAFASVASGLIKAGVRSVVAMGYNLYVASAKIFLPAFYGRLFETGDAGEAVRAGRQALFADQVRYDVHFRDVPFDDWLVPQIYQQQPMDLSFVSKASLPDKQVMQLPDDAIDHENPHGLIGRDKAILAMERALRQKDGPVAIQLVGMGGTGKTTLARGFLKWMSRTGGLELPPIWLNFEGQVRLDGVLFEIGAGIFGAEFGMLDSDQRIEKMTEVMCEHPFVMVWDNLESAEAMDDADRQRLSTWLTGLRGGKTKVILTSRLNEAEWLGGPTLVRHFDIGGLHGTERWDMAAQILRSLGMAPERSQDLDDLLLQLDGHPLMMRALLPKLAEGWTAAQIGAHLLENMAALGKLHLPPELDRKFEASMRLVTEAIDSEMRPVLAAISLHEKYVEARHLVAMAEVAELDIGREVIDSVMRHLRRAGQVRDLGQSIYALHPALTGHLRGNAALTTEVGVWQLPFAQVMSMVAHGYTLRDGVEVPLDQQRFGFTLHEKNFRSALKIDEADFDVKGSLLQGLGDYALNRRDLLGAKADLELFAELAQAHQSDKGLAGSYHQLGNVAFEQRDFKKAKDWYIKSLEIKEKLGDEYHLATTYHQLGIVAQEQRDFKTAEDWCIKARDIFKKLGDEYHLAITYHQLGRVAFDQRDFKTAEDWYIKARDIFKKLGNEYDLASTYHQLGRMAFHQRDFKTAEDLHIKSLEIEEKLGDEYRMTSTYHQLGNVALEQGDFKAAEVWYVKSLEIEEKLGDEHGMASTYHQLGMVAEKQRDFKTAEDWYIKARDIFKKLGIEYDLASTYHQLGRVAFDQRDFKTAETWYIKSLEIKEKLGAEHGMASTYHQLGRAAEEQGDFKTAETWYIRSLEIVEKLGNEHDMAMTYHQLGRAAEEQGDFKRAETWRIKARDIFEKLGDEDGMANSYGQLGFLALRMRDWQEAASWVVKSILQFDNTNDQAGVEQGIGNFRVIYREAPQAQHAAIQAIWQAAGLPAIDWD